MNGRALFAIAVGLAVTLTWLHASGAAGSTKGPLVLRVGDTVRIDGTKIGCAVARRSGTVMVECVPAGRTPGSYGTLADDRRVLVVRFEKPAVARTVFQARQHDPNPTTCR
jgi:hypothetical protein